MNYWKKVFERVRSGFDFFNCSPCKFSRLDRRSLFSNRITNRQGRSGAHEENGKKYICKIYVKVYKIYFFRKLYIQNMFHMCFVAKSCNWCIYISFPWRGRRLVVTHFGSRFLYFLNSIFRKAVICQRFE